MMTKGERVWPMTCYDWSQPNQINDNKQEENHVLY
jgi:hypothetical protein